ncbi:MAG: NAD-dependent epimerase/dehydratase [Sphingobacteriales bacterium]|nr:NAD-dependent epimerase/dehydratase [Sphingobacteriales bacterium]
MDILLTGASGFLGNSICKYLFEENIITLGRHNADIICDLSDTIPKLFTAEIVVHAAGKAHSIPKTYSQKQDFFDVNVNGTINLLKGLEQSLVVPKAFVFISSVAVYGLSQGTLIDEQAPLSARDPYGQSKIDAEQIIQKWCDKNSVSCTILRLPLLIGQNPPGNLGAMIRAIRNGYYFNIAGGLAKKSMLMAEDVARFILPVSQIGGIYNLTDGYHPSFKELSIRIANELSKNEPLNIPVWLANWVAKVGDIMGDKFPLNSHKLSKINSDLTFDDTKAKYVFGWSPRHVLEVLIIK